MKKQILNTLEQLIAREELNNKARLSVSANYRNIIPASNKSEVSPVQKEFVEQELARIEESGDISGFSLNVSLQSGVHEDDYGNIDYDQDWHEMNISFAGGEEEDEDGCNPDVENVLFFNVEFKSDFTSGFNVESFLRKVSDKQSSTTNMIHYEKVDDLLEKVFELYSLSTTFVTRAAETVNAMKFNTEKVEA